MTKSSVAKRASLPPAPREPDSAIPRHLGCTGETCTNVTCAWSRKEEALSAASSDSSGHNSPTASDNDVAASRPLMGRSASVGRLVPLGVSIDNDGTHLFDKVRKLPNPYADRVNTAFSALEGLMEEMRKDAHNVAGDVQLRLKQEIAARKALQEENEELKRELASLRQSDSAARRELDQLRSLEKKMKTRLQTIQDELEASKRQVSNYEAQLQKCKPLEGVVSSLRSALEESETRCKKLESENYRLQGQVQRLQYEVEDLVGFQDDDIVTQLSKSIKLLKAEVVNLDPVGLESVRRTLATLDKFADRERTFKVAHSVVKKWVVDTIGEHDPGSFWRLCTEDIDEMSGSQAATMHKALTQLIVAFENMSYETKRRLLTADEIITNTKWLILLGRKTARKYERTKSMPDVVAAAMNNSNSSSHTSSAVASPNDSPYPDSDADSMASDTEEAPAMKPKGVFSKAASSGALNPHQSFPPSNPNSNAGSNRLRAATRKVITNLNRDAAASHPDMTTDNVVVGAGSFKGSLRALPKIKSGQ